MSLSTIRSIAFAIMVLAPIGAHAQTSTAAAAASDAQLLKPAELDQLVAPIALYPDTLLAEVLMASAYPLDIVQAERWLEANKNCTGDQLKATVDKQPWDESIKSLIATPSVLQMMSEKLDWTEKLGDAVVAQQADLMDAIQRLRAKAQANHKLSSTKSRPSASSKCKAGRSLPSSRPTPTRSMSPITTPASSMAIGRIPTIRRITGRHPPILALASSPPALPSAPATRLAVGRRADVIGAAGSIGTTITSTLAGPAAVAVAAPTGRPALNIGKASATAAIVRNSSISAAAVVSR